MSFVKWAAVAALLAPVAASAQQPQQQPQQQQPPPQQQQPLKWESMPRMQLEAMFAGPLRDTIIQRWRDPALGAVCYLYLPITTIHSEPLASGYVQYGPNTIGTISCLSAPAPAAAAAPARGKGTPRPAARKGSPAPAQGGTSPAPSEARQ